MNSTSVSKNERLTRYFPGLRQDIRQDLARLESRLDGSIKALESRFDGLERQFGELRERMAHLEGLLEGLREAITGRVKAS